MSSGQTAIALFDVLGFRELVKRLPVDALPKLLADLEHMSGAAVPIDKYVGTMLFSDTIVLYGKQHPEAAIGLVTVAASNLLNLAARSGVAIRGALSFGHLHVDSAHNRIVGPALIDAYELEQQQDWMGAIVDPAMADRFAARMNDGPAAECLVRYRAQ